MNAELSVFQPHSIAPAPKSVPTQITQALPTRLTYKIPETLQELFGVGGSVMGHSAVSNYLSCPERSRLTSLGVHRRPTAVERLYDGPKELNELEYGTLIHALLAIRKVHGQGVALAWLAQLPIARVSLDEAFLLIRTWDYTFPLPESFNTIGIEVEIASNIGDGRLRTVRYDEVMWRYDPQGQAEVYGVEHKTMSRAPGETGLNWYQSQIMTQVALWNANPNLLTQWGPMRGVIVDGLIKTKVPKADRFGPIYVSPLGEQRIKEYLKLPESVRFPVAEDGSYPRMLHSCYGRFKPCHYVDLCLNGMENEYVQTGARPVDPVQVSGD